MDDHYHAPLAREDTLELAFELLERAAEHVDGGRISEAQTLNGLAQTAIALTERVPVTMSGPIH